MPRRWTLYVVGIGHLDDDRPEGEPDPAFATKAEAVAFAREYARSLDVNQIIEVEEVTVSDNFETTRQQLAALLYGRGWCAGRKIVSRHQGRRRPEVLCRRCDGWHRKGEHAEAT